MRSVRTCLPPLTPIAFGSGGITDPTNPDHIKVTRAAMDAGLWFHVGNYNRGVYPVLKKAFSEVPSGFTPRVIVKLDGTSRAGFTASLEEALRETGLQRIEIGQICGITLCPDVEALCDAMLAEDRIDAYIMDVIPAYSPKVIEFIRAGIFDGYILYYNVTECGMSNAALAEAEKAQVPLLAMRTFGGRNGTNFVCGADAASAELERIFERSGCRSRVEFCVRFAAGAPCVLTTVGSTSRLDHLRDFVSAGENPRPLDPLITGEILALHRRTNAGGA